ncbi:hypothetical protein [Sphingomicrobium sediminis]|uniref:Uncharacterized protein n=1 Tax=Sphingomicrobium sediminis TaxID=2950949 RepID=A0A9X2J2P8_9SPHN|nr:hypothetical protein [Sphingomicrobium sediminis]MCM8557994.1 hypothetical protein [Sphingomicrobium sediminis]
MDIDDTRHARKVAKMKSAVSNDDGVRKSHSELAEGFAQRIAVLREINEAKLRRRAKAPLRHVAPSDSVWSRTPEAAQAVADPNPEIIVHRLIEYSVGPYRYSNFEDALAEQIRVAEAQYLKVD